LQTFDVAIVGAGAAGLFCAGVAAQQGLQVLVIDHYEKVAEKIRISGILRVTDREISLARYRATHHKTLWRWCKATRLLFMKSTKANCFVTAHPKT